MKLHKIVFTFILTSLILLPAAAQDETERAGSEAETAQSVSAPAAAAASADAEAGSETETPTGLAGFFSKEGYNFFGRLNYQLGGSVTANLIGMQGAGLGIVSDLSFIFLGNAAEEEAGLFLAAGWQWHPAFVMGYSGDAAESAEDVEGYMLLGSSPHIFYLNGILKSSRTQYLEAGFGIGLYTVAGTMNLDVDTATAKGVSGTKLGFAPFVGWTFSGLQMKFIYNIVPTEAGEASASYFSIDIRFLDIFGGILAKDPEMSPYE